MPTWAVDYEYWLNEKWALGWHNDIELQRYVVNTGDLQDLEREYPFITSVVVVHVPWKTLTIYAGPGIELEQNENFFVMKLGVEYGIELPGAWDIAPGLSYDNKGADFDSWGLGFSFGKRF